MSHLSCYFFNFKLKKRIGYIASKGCDKKNHRKTVSELRIGTLKSLPRRTNQPIIFIYFQLDEFKLFVTTNKNSQLCTSRESGGA